MQIQKTASTMRFGTGTGSHLSLNVAKEEMFAIVGKAEAEEGVHWRE